MDSSPRWWSEPSQPEARSCKIILDVEKGGSMLKHWMVLVCLLMACGGKVAEHEDTSKADAAVSMDEGQVAEDITGADTGALIDTVVLLDEGIEPTDTAGVEPDWNWTWLQCRQAYLTETLSDEDQALCTEHYSEPPTQYRYGIRWVFLGHDEETVATYPETQMGDLNDIYAENDMEFFIHSRLRIVNPVAVEGAQDDTKFPISEFIGDIRQYLGTDEEDPQAVLDLFLAALAEKGVAAPDKTGNGNGLQPASNETTLETEWTANQLHGRLARLCLFKPIIILSIGSPGPRKILPSFKKPEIYPRPAVSENNCNICISTLVIFDCKLRI